VSDLRVYSLKNCDTCKKAIAWLTAQKAVFCVRDVRADGMTGDEVTAIVNTLGWEAAVNRRSTTWRQLDDAQKDGLDNAKAIELITANPTLMKRPVFVSGDTMLAGFSPKLQSELEALIKD
jgi:arsenate reductase